MSKVQIITERISSLSYEFANKHNILLIPANIVLEDETIKDDEDEKGRKFIEEFEGLEEVPSTATPSLGEMIEIFKDATKNIDDAIYISASSKLSSLHDVGLKAAKELRKEGKNVQVFDSYTTVSMCGMYALEASNLAKEGKSIDEIMDHLNTLKEEARITEYGVIETLKYLEKNGRIGKAKFWLSQLFSFKPIISARDGVLEPIAKVRTNMQGLDVIVKKIREDMKRLDASGARVIFDYGMDDEFIRNSVEPRLMKEFKIEVVTYSQMSPLIACHLGSRVWGVALRYE